MNLSFLQNLTDRPGPFATVYLDTSHDTEDADHRLRLRWSAARDELAEQDADAATVDALERAVLDGPPAVGLAGRALVGTEGEVVLDRDMSGPPSRPGGRWEAVPDLLPLLVGMPEPHRSVVVRIDQTGGEILHAGADAEPVSAEQVAGRSHPVHKVRAGGLSHLNMQERVEESWRRNTAEVAARVDKHVADLGADVVVLAGDAPARSQLRDALSGRAASLAVDVEHSSGADHDELTAAVAEAADEAVARRHRAEIERFEQAVGRDEGWAVEGVDAVLAALRAEQVEMLLLDSGTRRDGEVWVSDRPALVAREEAELRELGAQPWHRAGVDAALIRAAAATSASFAHLGGGTARPVADGVAALLRFPAQS